MDNPMWLYFGGFLFLQNTDGKAVKNIFLEATEILSRVGDSFLLYREKKNIKKMKKKKLEKADKKERNDSLSC